MNKNIKRGAAVLGGVLYGALVLLLAQCLIRNLGFLTVQIGGIAGLDQDLTTQVGTVLNQLQNARIVMPWLAGILLGAALGTVFLFAMPHRVVRRIMIVLAAVLFLPLVLAGICLAEVNDVQMVAILESVLPLLLGMF